MNKEVEIPEDAIVACLITYANGDYKFENLSSYGLHYVLPVLWKTFHKLTASILERNSKSDMVRKFAADFCSVISEKSIRDVNDVLLNFREDVDKFINEIGDDEKN